MKSFIYISAWLMIMASSVVFVISPCTAQQTTPLLAESFETGSGATPPSGWAIEQVTGTIPGVTFVNSSVNPTIAAAYDGNKFVGYNSFNISGGSTRMRLVNALSTLNHAHVLVDFAWFEDPGNVGSNDKVELQWSLNGTTWTTAATFNRYNAVEGWKLKHQWLPAGADNKPTLYIAFLFTSANGNNCALDLVHVTCGTSPVNPVLSGFVREVSSLVPINGAIVEIGTNRDTTKADGFYALYNVPTGSSNVFYTAGCYAAGGSTVNITAGVVNNADFTMMPSPAVQGTITDGCTGAPVAGAVVSVSFGSNISAMTNNAGYFLLNCIPFSGAQTLMISKSGYDTYTATVTLVPNTTITMNIAMLCNAVPPGTVTATLNTPVNPTAVNIGWTAPQGTYQLIYDDSSPEDFQVWASPGNLDAVKFTPLGWPAKVTGGNIHIGKISDYPANALPFQSFEIYVCKADGPGGIPGTILDSVTLTPSGFGWASFTFATPVTVNSGDFFLVMKQGGIPPHACGIAIDTTSSQLRSWSRFTAGGGLWTPASHNYMMRALMKGPGGPILLDNTSVSPSYQAWRLFQGQESTPANWISLYTGVASSCVDNSWTALPSGPYRWAVKAVYPPGTRLSSPSFSNVLGKNNTATVTIQSTSDCGLCGKNADVHLTNVAYPDTMYLVHLDSTGHGQRAGIWKGNYDLSFAVFLCSLVTQNNIHISGDTTLTFHSSESKPPATGLSINNQSLLATWNAPAVTSDLFYETWASGSFSTNQWTVNGGNWQISNTIGNPAPSALFNGTPQCTNCSQYLTSRSINATNAPKVMLSYDVSLSNFGTTNVNAMAVELWNGTTWSALKVYDNQAGSIPWTSEVFNISSQAANINFKVRFHVYGTDSYDINYWGVDNIRVSAQDTSFTSPGCLLGYNVYINNTLSLFTYDTSYLIPPPAGDLRASLPALCKGCLHGRVFACHLRFLYL